MRLNVWEEKQYLAYLDFSDQRYPISIKFRGYHIREFPKKSFDVFFTSSKTIEGNSLIHLNAEYKDPSLMRNKLSMDFFSDIGVMSPEAEHIFLTMNNKNAGIYLQLESMGEKSLERRKMEKGPIYYATNDDANFSLITPEGNVKKHIDSGYYKKFGGKNADDELKRLIYMINTSSKNEFPGEIKKMIDLEKYFLWLSGVVCTQNRDGFINNYSLYQNPVTGLFEVSPWDYDATWGRDINGRKLEFDDVPITGFNTLTARLLSHSDFRRMYSKTLQSVLADYFCVDYIAPRIKRLQGLIRPLIKNDPYIGETEKFDKEQAYITAFVERRRNFLMQHLNDLI
ncbi:CotH kinase family protein [Virgibacillus senegalensis]|uniref:CotH kinase family protein n=1 Tax=Virgibacillus senegalensis TaxID=1499679 RepID=UPI00069CC4BB|nr:CotH kinase family protein [Virgibacillus senegalensis]